MTLASFERIRGDGAVGRTPVGDSLEVHAAAGSHHSPVLM